MPGHKNFILQSITFCTCKQRAQNGQIQERSRLREKAIHCLYQIKVSLWETVFNFRMLSKALFRDWVGISERSPWPIVDRTTPSPSCLLIVLCLFLSGVGFVSFVWSHVLSACISFNACKEALITSPALQRSTEWDCRMEYAGFKAPRTLTKNGVSSAVLVALMLWCKCPFQMLCHLRPLKEHPVLTTDPTLSDIIVTGHLISRSLFTKGAL